MTPASPSDTALGTQRLGRVAGRGAVVMLQGQLMRVGLQIGGVVVLSRLLTPGDFGVVAMVTVLVGIAAVLRDFGLVQAAVQARSLTDHAKSNLFWINSSLGLVLAVIVACSAPAVAWLYGKPDLESLVRVMAFSFLFSGITAQFRAQLSRNMRFARLTSAEVAAQIVGLAVAVSLAANGAGYWAIVYQQIAEAGALVIFSGLAAAWLPGWYSRSEPMGQLLRFGGGMMGTQLVVYVSQNADSFLIGRNFGASSLGFYDRAFQLLMLPINQVSSPASKVALPVLSRLQDDDTRFESFLLRAQLLVSTLVIWGLLLCVATADQVITLLLGPDWEEAASLFRILGLAGCFQVLSYSTFWVFTTKGRTSSNFRFTLLTRVLLITAVGLGSLVSVTWVAVAYTTGLAVIWPLGLLWTRHWGPSLRMFLTGLRTLSWGSLGALASFAVASWMTSPSNLLVLLCAGATMMAVVVSAGIAVPAFRRDAAQMWDAVEKTARND